MPDAREPTENYDVAIVGAGPAGLSAALYAARFNRSVVVLHDNTSRAARIPLTQNAPGFDEGIAGFCAGDLVDGLDQISVAMGHGAAAATKAHNWLRTLDRETVESVLQPAADVL